MDTRTRDYLIQGSQEGQRFSLVPPRSIPQGVVGARMGMRPGSSLEFMDHRPYQVGDDLRRIDWNAYARSDKLSIKLYREEVNPHLDILLDGSRSMALANSQKAGAALAFCAAMSTAAANTHFTWMCHMAGAQCREVLNGMQAPQHWEGLAFDYNGTPAQSIQAGAQAWRARGIRFFVSDLLWLGEPEGVLSRLCENAGTVCVVQILARADVTVPSHGNLRLVDSETQQILEVFVDASVRKRYQQRLDTHQQNWHEACRHFGAVMVTLVAEDLLAHWDLQPLLEREILEIK